MQARGSGGKARKMAAAPRENGRERLTGHLKPTIGVLRQSASRRSLMPLEHQRGLYFLRLPR
eukprot:8961913-Pyramimonas_sp.AAC.1